MLLELYGVITILLVLLFAYSEIGQRKKPVGVFASLLLLLFGILFIISDVHYVSGYIEQSVSDPMNLTMNKTITPVMITATLPAPPFPTWVTFGGLIGTSILLLSMWGLLHYSDEFVF
jgi:hypothetical protein